MSLKDSKVVVCQHISCIWHTSCWFPRLERLSKAVVSAHTTSWRALPLSWLDSAMHAGYQGPFPSAPGLLLQATRDAPATGRPPASSLPPALVVPPAPRLMLSLSLPRAPGLPPAPRLTPHPNLPPAPGLPPAKGLPPPMHNLPLTHPTSPPCRPAAFPPALWLLSAPQLPSALHNLPPRHHTTPLACLACSHPLQEYLTPAQLTLLPLYLLAPFTRLLLYPALSTLPCQLYLYKTPMQHTNHALTHKLNLSLPP